MLDYELQMEYDDAQKPSHIGSKKKMTTLSLVWKKKIKLYLTFHHISYYAPMMSRYMLSEREKGVYSGGQEFTFSKNKNKFNFAVKILSLNP